MPRFDPHPDRRPALVTGASSGIGAATAAALAAAGHPVVLAARRTGRLDELAAQLRTGGAEAATVALDLTDPSSIDACAAAASEVFGPLDIVVSNAGEVVPMTALGADPDAFTESMHVNLIGAQRLLARIGPGMVERGRGDIVLVTSDVVVRLRTHMAAYVAAKAGLEALARAMQMELEGTGVRVGTVRPGPASTEQGATWSEAMINELVAHWSDWGLMRHDSLLRPEEIANAVVAMVSVPKGTHLTLIEVEPEAPVVPDRKVT
jgi:NADP-dependent 3-hydroxy acid dehydrogenase YdfG